MSFQPVDKNNRPGCYNSSEVSWGGNVIRDVDGTWTLIHAQMLHHCAIGSWKSNSIVARSVSTNGKPEGPYRFAEEVIPSFAHNPTVRFDNASKSYVIFFIGGWRTPLTCNASNGKFCVGHCNASGNQLREHSDHSKEHADRRSFDRGGVSGDDSPFLNCTGRNWPKSCGQNMPGPNSGCSGPQFPSAEFPECSSHLLPPRRSSDNICNSGSGIAVAHAKKLSGPWTVNPLKIVDQFVSDDVYCSQTNPSPFFLPNGSIILAFNAGYCSCPQQYNMSCGPDGKSSCSMNCFLKKSPTFANGSIDWSYRVIETIGLAVSHAGFRGPWHMLERNAIVTNPYSHLPQFEEDPFIYQSRRGWHLLSHNVQELQKNASGHADPDPGQSSYAYSRDGREWTQASTPPYDCTIRFTEASGGGGAVATGCGNRPQIHFGANDNPEILINGANAAQPGTPNHYDTWTLFRPLSQRGETPVTPIKTDDGSISVREARSNASGGATRCWKQLAGSYRGSMGTGGEDAIVIKALGGSPSASEAHYVASGYIWKDHTYTFSAFPNETTSQCTDPWCHQWSQRGSIGPYNSSAPECSAVRFGATDAWCLESFCGKCDGWPHCTKPTRPPAPPPPLPPPAPKPSPPPPTGPEWLCGGACSDGMVLDRTNARVWGHSHPDSEVSLRLACWGQPTGSRSAWSVHAESAISEDPGFWQVELGVQTPRTGYNLTIKSSGGKLGNDATLTDLAFGDVLLCSGYAPRRHCVLP
jgi:hypothetical protein